PGIYLALFCSIAFAGSHAFAQKRSDPDSTLVVFNTHDPDSPALAKYYAGKRGIPDANLVGLDCAVTEEITRTEYDNEIAGPLRAEFTKRGLWKTHVANGQTMVDENSIRFIALIRGMPLKIAPLAGNYEGDKKDGRQELMGKNEASVDSELACLGFFTRQISGPLQNPYYRKFTAFADANLPQLMLVCRLDGPSPEIVRGMIDDSLDAEKNGLWGFAYIDSRNIKEGAFAIGDKWLNAIADDAKKSGIPVIQDNGPDVFPANYPIRYAAFYYGWYAENAYGPFTDPNFRFSKGAVACHIHSFSASSVQNPDKSWAGPLLARGAAAVLGNVYEPYLALTPNLDIFHDRLENGFTFAESAYISQQALSWMTTFIGDPLYRPFKVVEDRDFDSLPRPEAEFAAYRIGARMWFKDGRAAGEKKLQTLARQLHSGIIYESLGQLQAGENDFLAAIDSFDQARKYYKESDDVIRVTIHEVSILRAMGKYEQAHTIIATVLKESPVTLATALLKKIDADISTTAAAERAAKPASTPAVTPPPPPAPNASGAPPAALPGTRTPGPWRPMAPPTQTGP
ncbi:MAG TPA: TIGR03790 family protein, partial [Chthoniobacteraceae bacterium]|nr:TIGR03790 family protein [Chthoniobacteraceae bacterium]